MPPIQRLAIVESHHGEWVSHNTCVIPQELYQDTPSMPELGLLDCISMSATNTADHSQSCASARVRSHKLRSLPPHRQCTGPCQASRCLHTRHQLPVAEEKQVGPAKIHGQPMLCAPCPSITLQAPSVLSPIQHRMPSCAALSHLLHFNPVPS